MLHHGVRLRASNASTSLFAVFQAAAGRAWLRTSDVKRKEGVQSGDRNVYRLKSYSNSVAGSADYSFNSEGDPSRDFSTSRDLCVLQANHQPPRDGQIPETGPSSDLHSSQLSFRISLAMKLQELEKHTSPLAQSASSEEQSIHGSHVTRPKHSRARSQSRRTGVSSIGAKWISPLDRKLRDPGRATAVYVPDPPLLGLTTVYAGPMRTLDLPILPAVTSPAILYQNLLYALSHRTPKPPALQALISYHAFFPSSMRSVRSYNFLIGLAIRHAAFGTVEKLMSMMHKEGIRGDLETWKLGVRWMVRSGRWGDGWKDVMRVIGRDASQYHYPETAEGGGKRMPLVIWMEFLGSAKRGAFRARNPGRNPLTEGNHSQKFSHAESSLTVNLTRYRLLMKNFPKLTRRESAREPPRTIYLIVQMMLRTDQSEAAMDLTQSYLMSLPSQLDKKWAKECLDIIHLHIRFRTFGGPYSSLRKVGSLLALHPGLRPTSTTLFILLSGMRRRRYCATQATELVTLFKRKWGDGLEDRRVRRRIANLAAKEGRKDLLDGVMAKERVAAWSRWMWNLQREVVGGSESRKSGFKRWLRAKDQQVFGGVGRENWRWRVLRWRIRRAENKWKSRAEAATRYRLGKKLPSSSLPKPP